MKYNILVVKVDYHERFELDSFLMSKKDFEVFRSDVIWKNTNPDIDYDTFGLDNIPRKAYINGELIDMSECCNFPINYLDRCDDCEEDDIECALKEDGVCSGCGL